MQTKVESDIITQAKQLAKSWQVLANELLTSEEKKIQQQMTRLLSNPANLCPENFKPVSQWFYQ